MGLFAWELMLVMSIACSKSVCNIFKPLPFLSTRIPDKRPSHTHTQTQAHCSTAREHINAIILRIRSIGSSLCYYFIMACFVFAETKMINGNNKLHNIIKKHCTPVTRCRAGYYIRVLIRVAADDERETAESENWSRGSSCEANELERGREPAWPAGTKKS